jgi:elongation factor Ts
MDPTYLTFDEVPQAEKDAATARFTEELKAAGKPEAMIPQIVAGKLNKEFAEDVLLEQESIHDNTKKVKDMISGDFQISKFRRFAI